MEKHLFDMEYSTQVKREVEFLKLKGILYTFVKKKNGIPTYKYTKTPELFLALVSFYMENN